MGACTSRDRVPQIDGAHAAEQYCFGVECGIKLQNVEFRSFQAAIKRFGYRIDMNVEHMRAISSEINLDVEKMINDPKSAYAIVYQDDKFVYEGEKYNIDNMIALGWLLCRHWNEETQSRELWHMINPTLEDEAPKETVMEVARDLIYVA